jgi:hypothetical protein
MILDYFEIQPVNLPVPSLSPIGFSGAQSLLCPVTGAAVVG